MFLLLDIFWINVFCVFIWKKWKENPEVTRQSEQNPGLNKCDIRCLIEVLL